MTLENSDRMVTLAAATELDRPGVAGNGAAFWFFTRASIRLCAAIAAPEHEASAATLQEHLARIADPRLQRAFAAALDIKLEKKKRPARCHPQPIDLWKGLRR
ncbi:hypothetical protein [Tardiphaga sp.]|uniref:hypothetical protein n=1 Tax=Tardiphaga sp. TaxID=1926292 RepID=UPI00262ACB0A|nr:hypothetical protein [Tardiphaga sp.]